MDGAAPIVLNAAERRVLGVLIEKGLTTPEYYPLSVHALAAGCNQKSNRDPLVSYDEAQVERALRTLESKGHVRSVIGDTGRVARWRQELVRTLGLEVTELAVVGELLLRGAQSEGDLRGRASRMRPIETLETLRALLQKLREPAPGRPALVVRLSPEGAARGVRWTHALPPPDPLEELREPETETEPAGAPSDLARLGERVAALERRVARLEGGGDRATP